MEDFGSNIIGKRLAAVQSNYIPWKGYFDLINAVDEFILFDDLQYTRRDWRNRNRIKTENGVRWLSIPVQVKGKYLQKIKDTVVDDPKWGVKHWNFLLHSTHFGCLFGHAIDYTGLLVLTYGCCSCLSHLYHAASTV